VSEKRALSLIGIGGFVYVAAVILGLNALGASQEVTTLAACLALIVIPLLASEASLRYGPGGSKRRD
jgi:hypothetical protein